jgi:hypothetical protein
MLEWPEFRNIVGWLLGRMRDLRLRQPGRRIQLTPDKGRHNHRSHFEPRNQITIACRLLRMRFALPFRRGARCMQASRIVSRVFLSRHSSRQPRAAAARRHGVRRSHTARFTKPYGRGGRGDPRVGAIRRVSCRTSIFGLRLVVVVSAGQDVSIRGFGFDFSIGCELPRLRD